MDDMEEFYAKLEECLLSWGESMCVKSNEDRLIDIENICCTVEDIFQLCEIPVDEDSSRTKPNCIRAFKYLLFRTSFECQGQLINDLTNSQISSHLPISPYILMHILYWLGYDEILAESLIHMPLDLINELLSNVGIFMHLLDFNRALNFLVVLILSCHTSMIAGWKTGAETTNLDIHLDLLANNVLRLMGYFEDGNFTRLEELTGIKKSERIGLVAKNFVALIKHCLANTSKCPPINPKIDGMYRIKFIGEPLIRKRLRFSEKLRMLHRQLVCILLRIIKDINADIWQDWVSLEADGDSTISLQQSIRTVFYQLIECAKGHNYLIRFNQLIECLKKFQPREVVPSRGLVHDELDNESLALTKDCVKQLVRSYSKWNHETFELVRRNRSLIDGEDLPFLLHYLGVVMRKTGQESHKILVTKTVRKILIRLNIPNASENNLNYFLRDSNRNTLKFNYTIEKFVALMVSDMNKGQIWATLILFLLNNPDDIWPFLLKIAIGDFKHENLEICHEDLVALHLLGNPKGAVSSVFVLVTLLNVFFESNGFDESKFINLVETMLNECVFTADAFMNVVFENYFYQRIDLSSRILTILRCIHDTAIHRCTETTRIANVLISLGKKIAHYRQDKIVQRSLRDEILGELDHTTRHFLIFYARRNVFYKDVSILNNILEQIEKTKPPFSMIFHHHSKWRELNFYWMVEDCKEYCIRGIDLSRDVRANADVVCRFQGPIDKGDLDCLNSDFIRYLFTKSTQMEYVEFATSAICNRIQFGFGDFLDAYDIIVRITIDVGIHFLEYPDDNSPQSFGCLIKSFANFAENIKTFFDDSDCPKDWHEIYDSLYKSVTNGINNLEDSIGISAFSSLYVQLVEFMKDPLRDNQARNVEYHQLVSSVMKFGEECSNIEYKEVLVNRESSAEIIRNKIAYGFIDICTNIARHGSDNNIYDFEWFSLIYRYLSCDLTP